MPIWGLSYSKYTHTACIFLSELFAQLMHGQPGISLKGILCCFFFLNWSIVDLQCSVSGGEQSDSVIYLCVYAGSFSLEVITRC